MLTDKKYIYAVDYGAKVCGVARADASSPVKIAHPFKIVPTQDLEKFILAESRHIESLVLGNSLNLKGESNPINSQIMKFKDFLENNDIKVFLQDERFSSKLALAEEKLLARKNKTRKAPNKTRKDAQAASLILQSFLDSHY